MKRYYILILTAFALITLLASSAYASLTDKGDGLIYDDNLNVTWLQNANYSGGTMTWLNAVDWAETLVFQGYEDWRLPVSDDTCSGKDCTESEMGHLFYIEGVTSDSPGLFTDVKHSMYWSSTEYGNDYAWRFSFKHGTQGTSDKDHKRYAWAVRDGDVIPPVVPEPVSSLLFITGGATLALRRYRKKKETV